VISVDRQRPRLAMATELGATATIDANELATPRARIDQVLNLSGGRGADTVP
jgi:threonine dehydrogenase-like Zn-dependent dehydrogenase